MRYTLLLILSILSFRATAQLSTTLHSILPDTLKPEKRSEPTLAEITKIIWRFDPPDSTALLEMDKLSAKYGSSYSKMSGSEKEKLKFLERLSVRWFNHPTFQSDSSLKYARLFLQNIKKGDKNWLSEEANMYQVISVINAEAKDFKGAIDNGSKAIQLNKLASDPLKLGKAYSGMVYIYQSIELLDKVIAYSDSAIVLFNKKTPGVNFANRGAYVWIAKSDAYIEKYRQNQKLTDFNSAYSILSHVLKDKTLEKRAVPGAYSCLAKLFYLKGDYNKAIAYADSGFASEQKNMHVESLGSVRTAYKAMSLIKTGKSTEGAGMLASIPDDENDFMMRDVYNNLYVYEKQKGNYSMALKYLEGEQKVTKNYETRRYMGEVLAAEQKYNATLKDFKISELTRKNQRYWFVGVVILLSVALLLTIILFQYHRRAKKIASLLKQMDELSSLQLIRIQETETQSVSAERIRLGRELHDDLAGSVATSARFLRMKAANDTDHTEKEITFQIAELLEESYKKIRDLAHDINTHNESSMDRYWKQISDYLALCFSGTEIKADINIQSDGIELTQAAKKDILLLLKEAVANVIKHANATEVEILLYTDPGTLVIEVSDNGRGMNKEARGKGMGLVSMKERAIQLDGLITFAPRFPNGTNLRITVPIENHISA